MNKQIKTILLGIALSLVNNVYCQSKDPCKQGNDKLMDSIPSKIDSHPSSSSETSVYVPMDPNEIIGTRGYDALGDTLQWVAATVSLPYTIYFENDPELATAAAQKVEVRHRLHAKADISTFAIGAFGFGSHVFTVEGNRSSYQQRLDLTQDMGIYVDVVAGIDIVAGEAFWILQSIDPATGLPPQGTQQGFLPVNDENHNGEGYVSFTIKPKANACITGDELTASASIVFDINEAIPTNVWYNTVDALPPITQLTGTDNGNNEVLLQFSGQDDEGGCGIKQYKLYVSDNYGAYSLYDTYPVGTTATYLTEYDHCYRFFCLGEDNVGNVEAMKEEAEFEYGNYNLMVSVSASPEEGGTVSGGGAFVYGSTVILTATPNPGYAFVNWTKNNAEVSANPSYSFTVTEAGDYVANFVESLVNQTTEFAQGWTWWSTYVEQEGIDGLSMLENSLGESGVGIVSQAAGYTYYYPDYGWYGSLAVINNESSYKINANEPCTAIITGQEADPSQHPITLGYGWTWIGYVPSVAMDVNEALSGLEAVAGDMLKSQEGYSEFYADYGWYGSLSTIESGMGLMYYSSNGGPVTFTYPNNGRGGELKQNLTSEHNHWKPNVYAYPDNMTVMAVVELGDTELSSDNYELAAFANGECRGSVRLIFAEPLHRHVAFLTVSGKDAAELGFRLYDTETGMEYYDAEESLSFVANAIVGDASELYVVHFRGTTGVDELANKVQFYPNPVNRGERFSINVAEDVKGPVRVEIVNALGVETLRATSVQTPATLTAPAVAGIYTLRITVEGKGTVVRKLVVK
jgi:hypothetical protein